MRESLCHLKLATVKAANEKLRELREFVALVLFLFNSLCLLKTDVFFFRERLLKINVCRFLMTTVTGRLL